MLFAKKYMRGEGAPHPLGGGLPSQALHPTLAATPAVPLGARASPARSAPPAAARCGRTEEFPGAAGARSPDWEPSGPGQRAG